MTREPEGALEALARYAAEALDWPAVRELILPFCASPLGRRALLELCPRSRTDAADALTRALEMQVLLEDGDGPPLGGATDPLPAMAEAVRYSRGLSGEELWMVARLLRLVEDLGHWLAGRRARAPRCDALWTDLSDPAPLREALEAALDRRGRVLDDASPVLARLRGEIETVGRELERSVKELANRPALRTAFAEGHAGQVHRRGGRLVVAVRQRHAGRIPGIVHDRSQSGETLFVEPRDVVESANRLAVLQADAEREASRILNELSRRVLGERDALEIFGARLAELELALVSARFAREHGGRPARLPGQIVEPGGKPAPDGLLLRGFRHPLLAGEAARGRIAEVVPLDLRLGVDFDLCVITGPNTGGKTLAIKSAGLAVLMTRMGLALPCEEGTTVPLYAGVVADIGDEQEIQQSLSTFSSHLARIREGLARASPETLVLLDELGSGTDPIEGAALGEALLEHLLERGIPTLASTHLGQLKEFAFRHDRAENAHVEFDVATLAPRYALIVGAPGESRALAIARRLGLPEELVARAESRIERRPGETQRLMEEMRDVRVDAERLRGEAEERLLGLERELAELTRERGVVERRKGQVEAEAQRGLEERVVRAREWLERARTMLPRLPTAHAGELTPILEGLAAALDGVSLTDRRRDFLGGLKKGEFVWIPHLKKRCVIVRIHRSRRLVVVRLGKREVEVGFDDVTFYESL